jgi:hypothetical protein
MSLALDHLAMAAETLEDGRAAVEAALGVRLQPGGRHARFGTHNMLLGLGAGLYLEVIAIDPDAPAPDGPRWFDLDRFAGRPRPRAWVCRTDDLDAHLALHPEAGGPVALARGALRWRMAVPGDGVLPFDNAYPAVIQWQAGGHPADGLAASGCRLVRLVVTHPEAAALAGRLTQVLSEPRVVVEPGAPGLRAEIATPHGVRVLE